MKTSKKAVDTKMETKDKHILTGLVVKAVLPKTVTVLVETANKLHPVYHKKIKKSKRYLVDDSIGVKEGALVQISKCRPISKNKHWRILKVVGEDIELMVNEQLKSDVAEAIAEVMPEEVAEETEITQEPEVVEAEKPKKKGKK